MEVITSVKLGSSISQLRAVGCFVLTPWERADILAITLNEVASVSQRSLRTIQGLPRYCVVNSLWLLIAAARHSRIFCVRGSFSVTFFGVFLFLATVCFSPCSFAEKALVQY